MVQATETVSTDYNEALLKVIDIAGRLLGKNNRKETAMKEKVYVGIDLAKASSRVAAFDTSGEAVVKPFSITNSKEGIKKLLAKLSGYKSGQIVCGMEISLKLLGEHVLIP